MDRQLIISDNLAPLAPSSRALAWGLENSATSHSRLVGVRYQDDPRLRLPDCDFDSRLIDARTGRHHPHHRLDLRLARQLRRAIQEFDPDQIHLFCERPSRMVRLLLPLRHCLQVHISGFHQQIGLAERWLSRTRLCRQLRWVCYDRQLSAWLQQRGIPDRRIDLKDPSLTPSYLAAVERDAEQVESIMGRRFPPASKLVTLVAPLIASAAVDDAIWACELLKPLRDDVHLVIIGDGPARETVQRYISYTSVSQQVHLLGWSLAAPQLIARSIAYCETSHLTPHSLASHFAERAGVPVVVPDLPVHRPLIRRGAAHYPAGIKYELGRVLYRILNAETPLATAMPEQAG